MIAPTDSRMTRQDKTPYIESRALKNKLSGIRSSAPNSPGGAEVPVTFVAPDMELRSAAYPGIYLSYAGNTKANDREVRGKVAYQYAPSGISEHVIVPAEPGNYDSDETVDWSTTFDRRSSPYRSEDHPIPYNLDFNVTVLTRNYQQMFEIISILDEIDYLPARFGGLEVPEDGTIRTLDLLGGPETSPITDEDNKRLLQSVYSVRVTAEISLYDVTQIQRVEQVALDVAPFTPYL